MKKILGVFSLVVLMSAPSWAGENEFNPLDSVYKLRGYIMHPIHEKVWEEYPGLKENQKLFINLMFGKSSMPPKIVFKQFQESWLDKKNPLGSWSIMKKGKNGKKKIVGLIGFRDGSNKGFNYVGGMRPNENITEFYWIISPNFDRGAQKIIQKALRHAFKKVKNLEEVRLGTYANEEWKKILSTKSDETKEKLKDVFSVVADTSQDMIPYQAEKAGFSLMAHYPYRFSKKEEKHIAVYKITREEFKSLSSPWNWLKRFLNWGDS